ncbi:MAG: helix-turn-helix domain-containing protein [Defluviitaleaceae bacterium]|nr:helix-turn-helix domain-containing protein [Defluviitaleaceae bacterium]
MRGMSIIAEALLHLNIGERIKELRESNNMSVKELAKQMKIGTCSLRMIELGGVGITAYDYLKLHEIFGVSLHYIITGKEFEKKPAD